jgi:7-carboxy-7-deazaguanine synthase
MNIVEIFESIQGEGPDTGKRTLFIRTARCNLRCIWCDTKYSWNNGVTYHVDELVKIIEKYKASDISITGGEPLLQKSELVKLLKLIYKKKDIKTVLIETNGAIDIRPYLVFRKIKISMDVKCPSSGMAEFNLYDNINLIRKQDVVKFVIKDGVDYNFAKKILDERMIKGEVIFQPVYGADLRTIAENIIKDKLNVRFMVQMHKYIWGDEKGH